jgi:DNA-binding MarR family transcriptional regulator
MQTERFNQFVQLIEGVHKSVAKIRMSYAPLLGVKSVHLFWLYELLSHPDGLTASSLAANGKIDRSLVSREIEELREGGYVDVVGGVGEKRKNYNSRIVLTEKGAELARTIALLAMTVQNEADTGVSEEELNAFYRTLGKLNENLALLAERKELSVGEQV